MSAKASPLSENGSPNKQSRPQVLQNMSGGQPAKKPRREVQMYALIGSPLSTRQPNPPSKLRLKAGTHVSDSSDAEPYQPNELPHSKMLDDFESEKHELVTAGMSKDYLNGKRAETNRRLYKNLDKTQLVSVIKKEVDQYSHTATGLLSDITFSNMSKDLAAVGDGLRRAGGDGDATHLRCNVMMNECEGGISFLQSGRSQAILPTLTRVVAYANAHLEALGFAPGTVLVPTQEYVLGYLRKRLHSSSGKRRRSARRRAARMGLHRDGATCRDGVRAVAKCVKNETAVEYIDFELLGFEEIKYRLAVQHGDVVFGRPELLCKPAIGQLVDGGAKVYHAVEADEDTFSTVIDLVPLSIFTAARSLFQKHGLPKLDRATLPNDAAPDLDQYFEQHPRMESWEDLPPTSESERQALRGSAGDRKRKAEGGRNGGRNGGTASSNLGSSRGGQGMASDTVFIVYRDLAGTTVGWLTTTNGTGNGYKPSSTHGDLKDKLGYLKSRFAKGQDAMKIPGAERRGIIKVISAEYTTEAAAAWIEKQGRAVKWIMQKAASQGVDHGPFDRWEEWEPRFGKYTPPEPAEPSSQAR